MVIQAILKVTLLMIFIFFQTLLNRLSADEDFIATTKWELIQTEKDYKVFKGITAHATGLYPFKIEAKLSYPFIKVLSVLDQTDRKVEWVPNLLKAELVKQISPYEKIERGSYDAPWPVTDREFLVHISAQIDIPNRVVIAKMHSIEIPDVPVKQSFVRGYTYNGNIVIKENKSSDTTDFEMIVFNDFKGSLPTWIVNLVQRDWPNNLIKHLKSQLDKNDLIIDSKFAALVEKK